MNYILSMRDEIKALQRELLTLKAGLNELRAYLNSAKFRCGHELDGYVNVADVLAYLRNAEDAAIQARERVVAS